MSEVNEFYMSSAQILREFYMIFLRVRRMIRNIPNTKKYTLFRFAPKITHFPYLYYMCELQMQKDWLIVSRNKIMLRWFFKKKQVSEVELQILTKDQQTMTDGQRY